MKPKILLSVLSIFFLQFSIAQTNPTSAAKVQEALQQKATLTQNSTVKNIEFTNIGPTIMSGRVVDLDVNPNNTTEFYVAYASGGLWYTQNNGTTFEPVLDSSPTQNIGDIAVDWKSKTIWVGTGENNSSRSSYAGIGILKSTDNGQHWENMGLLDSHHISRIVINPNNGNEVVVAVLGHLYSPNAERGIFKTTDGGKTWNKTLFVNADTGIVDLAVAPNNFKVQYASSWERDRKAWNFVGNGINSAIYKSTDAGQTWKKVSEKTGFPEGDGVGRIGLAVYDAETVYAFHDSQFRREDKKKKDSDSKALTKDDFKTMSSEKFLSLTDKELNTYLKTNGFQEKYRAENVKQLVRSKTIKPIDLAKYLENANSLLFDTPVIGAQVFKTIDGGKSWKKTHEGYLDDLVYSYGYYFGLIRVSPKNPEQIYIAGVPILRSQDGGKTYKSINGQNVHVDHHSLWVNPNNPNHLINGNDGGVNISYDNGDNWIKCNTPAVGQFYAIYADEQKPYKVYGGLQDNGVWVGPNDYEASVKWHEEGKYPYERIMGGDGMQVQIDNRNPNIVYTGYQFGNYFRIDRENGLQKYIQPKHELGESPYRFNWQTPIHLSVHNQDILYLGGNKLHRSLNKGDDWTTISDDLTQGGKKGNVAYGTLTSISESPFQFGLLYAGSDDGLIHVTKNGGGDWQNISAGLPKDLWVSRVIASAHKKERVYLTLNGYRWDDFTTYVYMSDNYGQTWKNIGNSIPDSPVNVIKEDPENENVLYLGTDNGAYASLDMGTSWQPFQNGLPNVAVHDIVVQKQAKDLLLGTHGRSIYKANIEVLQKVDETIKNKTVYIFPAKSVRHRTFWGSTWSKWLTPNVPKKDIYFHAKNAGTFTIKVLAANEVVLNEYKVDADAGFNTWTYDLSITEKGRKKYLKKEEDASIPKKKNGSYYVPKGTYSIEISGNGGKDTMSLVVE
ncbi:glycosyl hydrolase [Kordia sp. YSTF-M3]|uniref:Glycosyl hydrolase n=1 Tax=Kordia aestuariivivens TaxID=2759037 RepID=A0ABR7Q7B3_9FLAO|nr:glycosyl hydrolase [Kordia aestuariivivens]MBC8754417.1 glycosyl hydrolase [Kordia aestuariivivens]